LSKKGKRVCDQKRGVNHQFCTMSTHTLKISYPVPFEGHHYKRVDIAIAPTALPSIFKCVVGWIANETSTASVATKITLHEFTDIQLGQKIFNITHLVQPTTGIEFTYDSDSMKYTMTEICAHMRDVGCEKSDFYEEEFEMLGYDWQALVLFVTQTMKPFLSLIMTEGKRLQYEKELEGKECPVLMEPLKINASMKLKCGHYLSRTAWHKQTGTLCPLCRVNCDHSADGQNIYM